jgi:hypothetical protein
MARTRVSTTVDSDLLAAARRIDGGNDSSVVERALRALVDTHRAAEIDSAYAAAYRDAPLDAPDDWGDLASFHDAVSR